MSRTGAPQVLVLCYHAVSETWPAPLSVTPEALARQLTALVEDGWTGATFTDAVLHPPAPRTLAVTFDDGFRSVASRAAPILADLGLPGTAFIASDWPGRTMHWPGIDHWLGTPYESELAAMSWDEIRALADAGWEIGGHTCSHPRLTTVDDATLEPELVGARSACERELARPCRSIAYPFGDCDARVRDAAAAAGYEAAAGLSSAAFVDRTVLEWPRVGVWHGESDRRFRLKTSSLADRVRRSRLLSEVDGARKRGLRA